MQSSPTVCSTQEHLLVYCISLVYCMMQSNYRLLSASALLSEHELHCYAGLEQRQVWYQVMCYLHSIKGGHCLRSTLCDCCLQVAAVSCTRLKALQLPKHLSVDCLPAQAVGHLRGLQVTGTYLPAPPLKARRRR